MSAGRSSTTCAISAARLPVSRKRSNAVGVGLARVGSIITRLACVGAAVAFATGCASLIGGKAADTLSAVILNQDDPKLIESGVPAYLLAIDGLISQHPDNVALLSGGAQLFAFYGSNFVPPDRAVTLTTKARRYGDRAICLVQAPACHWADTDYTQFVAEL